MKMVELKKNIYYVGVQDPELKVFDVIMSTAFGTTYNAYLVCGEKSALIETAHNKLVDTYIEHIESVKQIKEINYVICNHTEPDHSGSLVRLLEINPDIEVIGTTAALRNLKEITNRIFKERVAKDGDTLDLGNGMVLKFIVAPNLHWPDTMMTYVESEKTLFSCDVLGAHYCGNGVTDEEIVNESDYEQAFQEYYDAIVSPFNPFVVKGLAKLTGLEIDMVCTSHGPVLKKYITKNLEKYAQWSKPVVNQIKQAAIYYVSAYGYTEKMAAAFAEGLKEQGMDVFSYNIIESDMTDMLHKLHTVDALVFGSPTINRNAVKPVWDIISSMDIVNMRNKPVAVFGSYGWTGEACTLLEQHLKALRLNVFETPITAIFNPSDEKLAEVKEYAKRFADSI